MAKRDMRVRRRGSAGDEDRDEPDSSLHVVSGGRRRRRFSWLRVLFRLVLVALAVVVATYFWQNADNLSPANVMYWVNEKLSGGQSGDGFPVEITGSSVVSMTETQDGLAMVTDTAVVLVNQKGGETYRRQHGFSNPVMKTAGKWVLIADSGGNRVRLESRAATELTMTVNNKITGVAVNRRGDIALVTGSSQGYTSEVVVYDRHQTVMYHWVSSELTILDAALSDNGESMVTVGVTAENGAMKSVIQWFDFSKDEPVAEYSDTDVMLFAVHAFPGGTVAAVGDTALRVVNQKGSINEKHSYNDHQLVGYACNDDGVSAVLRHYGTSEGGSVLTVNPSGEQDYLVTFTGSFRSIASTDSGLLLLTADHLLRFTGTGKVITGEEVREGIMVSALGNHSVVLSLTTLSELPIPRS